MKAVVPSGFLVAVEGVDGAGKTSVSALLAQYCGERGLLCVFSKEPTGLNYGKQLRESAKLGRLDIHEELALFLKDRLDHAERSIRPALEAGGVVILDRYFWSNAAYQGARGIDPLQIIADNERFAPRPDLVLLLDLPPESGLQRVRARGDEPNEFEQVAALTRAREIFNQVHDRHPDISVRLDASGPLRGVHQEALGHFKRVARDLIARRSTDPFEARAVLELLAD